jgi:hypothetical protein
LAPYGIDRLLFLIPQETDNKNFELASRNLQNVSVAKPNEFNISEMLRSDYIFMTRQGLQEFESVLESRQANYYRNRKISSDTQIAKRQAKRMDPFVRDIMEPILNSDSIENYNDEQPIVL